LTLGQAPGSGRFNQSKLLVVGAEGSGKTSLLEYLFPVEMQMESKGLFLKTGYFFRLEGRQLTKRDKKDDPRPHKDRIHAISSNTYELAAEDPAAPTTIILKLKKAETHDEKEHVLICPSTEVKDVWVKRLNRCLRESKTEGVAISHPELDPRFLRDRGLKEDFKLSVWDFGGPKDFRAYHPLFYSLRSVFMVVWNMTDSINALSSWLETLLPYLPSVTTEGVNEVSIIIVGTHKDKIIGESENKPKVDALIRELKISCPYLYFEVNSVSTVAEKPDGPNSLLELREAIFSEIAKHSYICSLVPEPYVLVQKAVRASRKRALPFVTIQDLQETNPDVNVLKSALSFCVQAGDCLFYDDSVDNSLQVVVNPQVLLEGAFPKLFSEPMENGHLEYATLNNRWKTLNNEGNFYHTSQTYMDFFTRSNFCFLPVESNPAGSSEKLAVFPIQLQDKDAATAKSLWESSHPKDCIQVERYLQFSALPLFFVSEVICTGGSFLKHDTLVWRTGIILALEGSTALIRADLARKVIHVVVAGNSWQHSVDSLNNLVKGIFAKADTFPGLTFSQMVTSPFARDALISLEVCISEQRMDFKERSLLCPKTKTLLPVDQVLSEAGVSPMTREKNGLLADDLALPLSIFTLTSFFFFLCSKILVGLSADPGVGRPGRQGGFQASGDSGPAGQPGDRQEAGAGLAGPVLLLLDSRHSQPGPLVRLPRLHRHHGRHGQGPWKSFLH